MAKRSTLQRCLVLLGLAAAVMTFAPAGKAGVLQVHEWGTCTALQDEHGDALPGINIDDEPLPPFCHNLCPWVLKSAGAFPRPMMKGAPERHPYVTLRLETPVLYFHPAAEETAPFTIDVHVKFHGGWLTEFYPQARPDAPGLGSDQFNFGPITPQTLGQLTWKGVTVGGEASGPPTAENVWLAPRDVRASSVTVPPQTDKDHASEAEKFLFYRGVANRPVPLRVSHDLEKNQLSIRGQCADVLHDEEPARISALWLVNIRRDGTVAWRALDPIKVTDDTSSVLASTSSRFAETEYSAAHLEAVRMTMHKALVADGLNPDEATAMLNTWRRAYFQSPGLRLFFLVPHAWTNGVLPLHLSRSAEVHRVMMGRIELISADQRQLLRKLASTPASDPEWMQKIPDSANARRFREGRSNFGDLGVKIPDDYQIYLDLGRFRNALVLAEQRVRQTPQLNEFINAYGLWAFQPQ